MTLSDELREHMRKLGQKGGKRRLETMTPEERSKAARKARIDQISQHYAAIYWKESEEGKLPNLGLIIREAIIEYRKQT